MEGDDIQNWQETLNRQMDTWNVNYQLPTDGKYGIPERDLTASVAYGLGLESAAEAMADGVTPELRIKLRNKNLSKSELERYDDRADWRAAFKDRYDHQDISPPLATIISSSWGYHPGVHDGVDLICKADAPLLAICRAKVIRVSSYGWWGNNPQPTPDHPVSDGDGIIILRSLTDDGPFRKGLNFGYGHAEGARVDVGDVVEAGRVIGRAGFARAWHVHFMVNNNDDTRGVGDRDPMPYVNYARSHG